MIIVPFSKMFLQKHFGVLSLEDIEPLRDLAMRIDAGERINDLLVASVNEFRSYSKIAEIVPTQLVSTICVKECEMLPYEARYIAFSDTQNKAFLGIVSKQRGKVLLRYLNGDTIDERLIIEPYTRMNATAFMFGGNGNAIVMQNKVKLVNYDFGITAMEFINNQMPLYVSPRG
jgi:hypothetical protein